MFEHGDFPCSNISGGKLQTEVFSASPMVMGCYMPPNPPLDLPIREVGIEIIIDVRPI